MVPENTFVVNSFMGKLLHVILVTNTIRQRGFQLRQASYLLSTTEDSRLTNL